MLLKARTAAGPGDASINSELSLDSNIGVISSSRFSSVADHSVTYERYVG